MTSGSKRGSSVPPPSCWAGERPTGSTRDTLEDDQAERNEPHQAEPDRKVNRGGVTGQGVAVAHGAISLVPAQQSHQAGDGCQYRKAHAKQTARAGDRQLRNEL